MAKFNVHGFIRDAYLRSEPSVDIDKATAENPIKCSDHRISFSAYDALLHEYGVTDEKGKTIENMKSVMTGLNMWLLASGPSLYDDKKSN